MRDSASPQVGAGRIVGVGLVGQQAEIAGAVANVRISSGCNCGLSPAWPAVSVTNRGRAVGIDEGVDFGGPSAAGAPQRVISRLLDQIRVIRQCPLCGARSARQPRAGGPGCWWNRSTPTRPGRGHRRHRRVRGPQRTSPRRCHQPTSGGVAPKPIATHQVQVAHPATEHRCGSAMQSPPTWRGDHSRADHVARPRTASPARSQPRTNRKSQQYASFPNDQTPTAKSLADTP